MIFLWMPLSWTRPNLYGTTPKIPHFNKKELSKLMHIVKNYRSTFIYKKIPTNSELPPFVEVYLKIYRLFVGIIDRFHSYQWPVISLLLNFCKYFQLHLHFTTTLHCIRFTMERGSLLLLLVLYVSFLSHLFRNWQSF